MFVRFLIAKGKCTTGLDAASPWLVAHWRLSSLPRYLQAEDVERVVASCDPRTCQSASVIVQFCFCWPGWDFGRTISCSYVSGILIGRAAVDSGFGKKQTRDAAATDPGAWPSDCGLPAGGSATIEHRRRIKCSLSCAVSCLRQFRDAVTMMVASAMRRAGVTCPSGGAAHVLRHSAATSMLRHGASLQDIAAILRHRSVETTKIYAKVDVTALAANCSTLAGGAVMLTQAVESYLALRRTCGFELRHTGNYPRSFAAFSDARGKSHVCSQTAIESVRIGTITYGARPPASLLSFGSPVMSVPRISVMKFQQLCLAAGIRPRELLLTSILQRMDIERLVQAASQSALLSEPRHLQHVLRTARLHGASSVGSDRLRWRTSPLRPGHPKHQVRQKPSRSFASNGAIGSKRYIKHRLPYYPFDSHVFVSMRGTALLIGEVERSFSAAAARSAYTAGRSVRPHSIRCATPSP